VTSGLCRPSPHRLIALLGLLAVLRHALSKIPNRLGVPGSQICDGLLPDPLLKLTRQAQLRSHDFNHVKTLVGNDVESLLFGIRRFGNGELLGKIHHYRV
jgi:hypothetical protein